MTKDKDRLIERLDGFIRKYYQDQLIRGALYSVGLLVAFFLAVSLGEYFGHFGTQARTFLFWGYVFLAAAVLVRFIVLPLFRLFHLGRVIGHDEAARIIGRHFPEVSDKLLNTLQLKELAQQRMDRQELLLASIDQRSQELGRVPFANAIDLGRNRKYLRFALPPLVVLLALLFAAPSLIKGPTQRLLAYGNEFLPEAPFRFVVDPASLVVPEQEDAEITVELQGSSIPQQVQMEIDGQRIPLVRKDAIHFTHRFRNVQAPIDFRFSAEGFHSETYTLKTEANPMILGLELSLEPPSYLGRPMETIRNTGDVTVPAGTRITWRARTKGADRTSLAFDDSTYSMQSQGENSYATTRRMLHGTTYKVVPGAGEKLAHAELQYRVEVVPDLFPTIGVEERTDSLALKRIYFRGDIADDHGFTRLLFHFRFASGGDSLAPEQREGSRSLNLDPGAYRQAFFHAWDLYDLPIQQGDRIDYWFEVWDNDGVNGSKSARSATRTFSAPTIRELSEKREQDSEAIKSAMKESIKEAQDLQRELEKLRRDLLDKKELNWQDKQKLDNVLERQKQLQQNIQKSTEQLRQSQQQQQEFRQMDERLLEKQEQLQDLFENVLSEEMKELYRKVEEMMEKLDKDQLQEQMEEMKLSQEDIEKELDRSLELFKQMEVEQEAEDIAEQLDELAKEQKELSEETEKGSKDQEDLKKEQEALNEKFDALKEDLDALEKKNEELESPVDLPDTEQEQKEIDEQMDQSSEDLQKEQNKKASENQQGAAEKMEQLAFQMRAGAQGSEQQEEDMDALRQLLENIVELSFDQESVMDDLQATSPKDPRYVDMGRQQKKLRDDARVIEDSLFALSKRVPQIQSIVNREMNAVNSNMDQAVELISDSRGNERQKPVAAEKQQRAMTSLNNLALLLDEALQQMMQQMAQQMPGSGQCDKPGGTGSGKGKKPSMAKMKAMQEALNKQLEEMRKGQQKGPKPGEKNPGTQGMPGMSQQLAQMAAQQAAIRKEMQRLAQELNKDGSGGGNGLNKLAQQMEQTEKDIVNRRVDRETLERQQDIMIRLLEAENAERERELDQKRASTQGRDAPPQDPARFFEYQRRKDREAELLRTVPPGLKPYYKQRVNDYFGTFDRP